MELQSGAQIVDNAGAQSMNIYHTVAVKVLKVEKMLYLTSLFTIFLMRDNGQASDSVQMLTPSVLNDPYMCHTCKCTRCGTKHVCVIQLNMPSVD